MPLSRIRREDETFSARRNSVISSRVVGKTLNSTGRVTYIPTSKIITLSVMLAEINRSTRNGGIGTTMARTMPSTALGTASSPHGSRLSTGAAAGDAFPPPRAPRRVRSPAGPAPDRAALATAGMGALWADISDSLLYPGRRPPSRR